MLKYFLEGCLHTEIKHEDKDLIYTFGVSEKFYLRISTRKSFGQVCFRIMKV